MVNTSDYCSGLISGDVYCVGLGVKPVFDSFAELHCSDVMSRTRITLAFSLTDQGMLEND